MKSRAVSRLMPRKPRFLRGLPPSAKPLFLLVFDGSAVPTAADNCSLELTRHSGTACHTIFSFFNRLIMWLAPDPLFPPHPCKPSVGYARGALRSENWNSYCIRLRWLDDLWSTYYRTTFNPARVRLKAMVKEMPRHYWPNMPETSLIPAMVAEADQRVAQMNDRAPASR